ncbi:hypothetical protein RISK_004102 [Rhodopirellula islandica]|uniref:Uncharacterized protein n=1 Tax=Rhodopirellula islandica TaxID=595434 RepID=A0A0J1BAE8_RHOIS|nr:hypothetical protein RISK_004102 [Rhodopirellula islandica]
MRADTAAKTVTISKGLRNQTRITPFCFSNRNVCYRQPPSMGIKNVFRPP